MSVVLSGVSTAQWSWLMPLLFGMVALLLGTVMLLMSRERLRAAALATVPVRRSRRTHGDPVATLDSESARLVVRSLDISASMPSRAPPGPVRSSRPDLPNPRGSRTRE